MQRSNSPGSASTRGFATVRYIATMVGLGIAAVVTAIATASAPERGIVEGRQFTLADYRGRVVYMEFVDDWQQAKARVEPWMRAMRKVYGNQGLLAIVVETGRGGGAIRASYDEGSSGAGDFLLVRDRDGELASRYYVTSLPATVMLNRSGSTVVKTGGGYRHDHVRQVESAIHALLKDRPLPSGVFAAASVGCRYTSQGDIQFCSDSVEPRWIRMEH